jgi:flagellar FliJ protein
MTAPSALDTLIELASSSTDAAARHLGVALAAVQNMEQKLALLVQYREDYAERLAQNMANGLTAMGYRNFQAFIDKLDDAIKAQTQVVEETQRHAGMARTNWQANERKRMSFNTLSTRAEEKRKHEENRRDQKQTHEAAARLFLLQRQA